MFDLVCGFCQQPANHSALGPLLGPIQGTEYYVHRPCALWSPEVHESEEGTLHRVLEAVRRGRQLKCSHCGKRGASVGCQVPKCRETYHALCAHEAGCPMYHAYCIACPQHGKRYKKYELHPQPFFLVPSASTPAKDPIAGNAAADQFQNRDGGHRDGRGGGATPAGGGGIADFFSPLNLKTSANPTTPAAVTGVGEPNEDFAAGPSNATAAAAAGRKKRHRGHLDEAYARKAQAEEIMKRVRAQHRRQPIENVSDDEEHFGKRESARMQRDIAKLNPITLGIAPAAAAAAGGGDGSDASAAAQPRAAQSVYIKAPKGAPKTAAPQVQLAANTSIVDAVTGTDFDDLAGMADVVRHLREMVLLPLQYPELFRHLGVSPPRGILFHGVPGTGKTLAARALAGACARHSPVPVTFFARKGADCLGKFVGEAERTLRLMFQEASARAPAIIFLDELDALVPSRSRGSGPQDQIHASVVSTLLTLMDGMADRGNVVVVASTNRPDDIDPALRRPGRFDREVYFGLPQAVQREAILKAHTRRWDPVPDGNVIKKLAAMTDGYAGADLAALCTAAVMNAVRRMAPQLLEHAEALADDGDVCFRKKDRENENDIISRSDCVSDVAPSIPDMLCVEPMDWDAALASAPQPCSKRQAAQALAADARRQMAYHVVPLLLPSLRNVLEVVGKSALPLPLAMQQATEAALGTTTKMSAAGLESTLAALGAIQRPPDHLVDTISKTPLPSTPSVADIAAAPSTSGAAPAPDPQHALTARTSIGTSCPPLRLLISSTEDAGQDQIAGALLRLFGDSHVSVISLPAIVAEGAGDAAQGVVSLVQAALQRADRHATLVLHLPHVEAWAVASDVILIENKNDDDDDEVEAREKTGSKATNAIPFYNGGALSPTSPSFAGLSARSLRMGTTITTTTTKAPAVAHHQQFNTTPIKVLADREDDEEPDSYIAASDAWIAFESLIQEASPQQPILILATSSAPRDLLPSSLVSVFESSGGIACVDDSYYDTAEKKEVEMVVTEGMKRVQETAKSAFAKHAASVFLDRVVDIIEISSSKERKEINRNRVEKLSEDDVALDPANLASTTAVTVPDIMPLDQSTTLAEKRKKVNLNNSEWEKAQELFTSVQRFLVALGATLAKDRRCRAAGATFPPKIKKKILPPGLSTQQQLQQQPPPAGGEEHVRLYTLAVAAAQGRYLSMEQFQSALASAVHAISKAAEQEERTGQELLHHSGAVALAHSIQDQVASACHALRTSLELYDPVNARLLRAATEFAADVALVYQQKENEAIAAAAEVAMAAEMEEAELAAAAEAAELERELEEMDQGEDQEDGFEEEEEELMDIQGEEKEQENPPAIQEQATDAPAPACAATAVPEVSDSPLEKAVETVAADVEIFTAKEPEQEEKQAAPAPVSSSALLVAAVHEAAIQVRTDLLARIQFKTNSTATAAGSYASAWRAMNEALPVLVAQGMAVCDLTLETVLAATVSVGDDDELSGLRTAFVNILLRSLVD